MKDEFFYNGKKFIVEKECDGTCCKFFSILGKTKEEIHKIRIDAEKILLKENFSKENYDYVTDTIFIDEMLISLGKFTVNPFAPDLKLDLSDKPDGVEFFTCKHFDMDTKLCKEYNRRPYMCRSYPHNLPEGKCEYKGCTYKYFVENEFLNKEVIDGK